MAADMLSAGGVAVTVYDRMPSVGPQVPDGGAAAASTSRILKPPDTFLARYGAASAHLQPMLEAFPPLALIDWANALGADTFTGSSGRIFPKAMKASPLLRAWLGRLNSRNVQFRLRHDWRGWSDGALRFHTSGRRCRRHARFHGSRAGRRKLAAPRRRRRLDSATAG